jgi:hypothetical protein
VAGESRALGDTDRWLVDEDRLRRRPGDGRDLVVRLRHGAGAYALADGDTLTHVSVRLHYRSRNGSVYAGDVAARHLDAE